jgi:hypothetical protein
MDVMARQVSPGHFTIINVFEKKILMWSRFSSMMLISIYGELDSSIIISTKIWVLGFVS